MLNKRLTMALVALAFLTQTAMAQEVKLPGTDESDRTIAVCYEKIQANPKSAALWRDLGLAFYQKGELGKAEAALKQANMITPEAQTNLYLGLIFERQKEMDKAIDAYGAALNLNPKGKVRVAIKARLDGLMVSRFRREASSVVAEEKTINAAEFPDNTIAVVNFDGSRLTPEMAQIGLGFAEFTANDLGKVHSLRVVDRLKLDVLIQELNLGQSGAIDQTTAPRIGRLVGSKRIVTGSLISSGTDQIRLDGAIVNTTDKTLNLTKPSEGDVRSFFKIEKTFVFDVLDKLGITPTAEERDEISKVPTESYLAFLAYCKGLDYEQRGMFNEASGAFDAASRHDRNFNEPKLQLGAVAALSAPAEDNPESFDHFQAEVLPKISGPGTNTGLDYSLAALVQNLGPLPVPTITTPALLPPVIGPTGTVIIRGRFDAR